MYIKKTKNTNELNKKCKCVDCIYCKEDIDSPYKKRVYRCTNKDCGFEDRLCYFTINGPLIPSRLYKTILHWCVHYESVTVDDNPYSQYQLF